MDNEEREEAFFAFFKNTQPSEGGVKRNVGFVPDGLLLETFTLLRHWARVSFKDNHELGLYYTCGLEGTARLWKVSLEVALKRFYTFHLQNGTAFQGMSGAKRALENIKRCNINPIAVAGRNPHLFDVTKDTLERVFPGIFSKVLMCGLFSDGKPSADRAKLLKDENISILVEGNLTGLKHADPVRLWVILVDAPWNQLPADEPLPPGVLRVASLAELEGLLSTATIMPTLGV